MLRINDFNSLPSKLLIGSAVLRKTSAGYCVTSFIINIYPYITSLLYNINWVYINFPISGWYYTEQYVSSFNVFNFAIFFNRPFYQDVPYIITCHLGNKRGRRP